jgi:hypothetical protein
MSEVIARPAAGERVFDKVALLRLDGTSLDMGTLAMFPDHLEFEGKRNKLRFSNIRGVTAEEYRVSGGFQKMPRIRIMHGMGDALSITFVARMAMGLPKKVREANGELYEALQGAYGETHLTGPEQERIARVDEGAREAKVVRARRYMWIGAALAVIGALITVITIAAAASGGGIYIVAYGPLLAGLGLFLTGLVDYRRNRRSPT